MTSVTLAPCVCIRGSRAMFPKPVLHGPAMDFSAPFRLSVTRVLRELHDFTGAPIPLLYLLHRKLSNMRDTSIVFVKEKYEILTTLSR